MELAALDQILEGKGKEPFDVIEVLQDIQQTYRYLPEDALCIVSEKLGIPLIEVYRLANFYNAFNLKPPVFPSRSVDARRTRIQHH